MPKISACIISFNEENKIEDCIRSLLPVADEIVIVDSGSSDRTIEIARRYTNNIYEHAFEGYGRQKNHAVDKASHDWILSLDCDERLSEKLQASILHEKTRLENNTAYRMSRKTCYIYRWLNHCWYPDRKTRLFNRKTTRWLERDVHESVDARNLNLSILEGDIEHHSFDSISEHLKTIDRFTDIGADQLIADKKSFSVFSPVTHAAWTFLKLYIIKRGFLDGFAGLVVSVLSGMHVFVKYSKAIVRRKQAQQGQPGSGT